MTLESVEIVTRILAELAIILGGFGLGYYVRRVP
jgi:hypothetical protein